MEYVWNLISSLELICLQHYRH